MNTWRSLLWKEWREQRAVGLAILAVLVLVPPLAAFSDLRDLHFGISTTLIFATPLFAVFIGMGIASGEHSKGTIHFLQAMPTSAQRAASAKLLVGIAVLLVPIVLAAASYSAIEWICGELMKEPPRFFRTLTESRFPEFWGASNFYVSMAVGGSILSASLLIWTIAVGANRKDEISAGAMAIGVIAAVYAGLLTFVYVVDKLGFQNHGDLEVLGPILACFPGAAALVDEESSFGSNKGWFLRYGTHLFFAILSHATLIWIFLKRYGSATSECRELSLPYKKCKQSDWLAPPRRSPSGAIAWKAIRELAPVALVGLAVTLALLMVSQIDSDGNNWRESALFIWSMVGGFVSMALGIGVFREDLEPALHTFWRSRPVSLPKWFWIKFAIAPASIIIIIGAVAAWLMAQHTYEIIEPAFLPSEHDVFAEQWDSLLNRWMPGIAVLLVHLSLYIGAFLLMILVRHPIFAAVLDAGLLMGLGLLSEYVFRWIGPTDWNGLVIGIPLVLLCMAGAAILSWQAFKKNWSLESWLG